MVITELKAKEMLTGSFIRLLRKPFPSHSFGPSPVSGAEDFVPLRTGGFLFEANRRHYRSYCWRKATSQRLAATQVVAEGNGSLPPPDPPRVGLCHWDPCFFPLPYSFCQASYSFTVAQILKKTTSCLSSLGNFWNPGQSFPPLSFSGFWPMCIYPWV